MKFSHKVRVPLAALAILGGTVAGGVAAAGPAAAASTACPNAESFDFYDSSGHLAAIGYYERFGGNGNDFCAQLIAQGAYYGESKYMEVDINNGNGSKYITDGGYYSYYAGPITLQYPGYPACPQVHFQMDDSSGNQILNYAPVRYCD